MLLTLADLLPYSVPVALSPLPIIAALMLLLAPGGNRAGACFLAGRIIALISLVLLFSLVIDSIDRTPANRVSRVWLQLGLGLALLAAAAATLLRPKPDAGQIPGWTRSLQDATPARAVGLGALLTVVNLKEIALVAGAGLILGAAALPLPRAFILATAFAVFSALGVALPVIWSLAVAEARKTRLVRVRDWLLQNGGLMMAVVLAVIGALLIGNALRYVAAPSASDVRATDSRSDVISTPYSLFHA